ncbi:hypothetical protein [Kitasatospora sp. MBT66]|uniref:hypothetical protein n=1 Tax=Kitasatospora sp. MBT66 TaxID=1444769 RepID=UPI0009E7C168|nr:hypothetical protein [Kitasatospora sp. MBT66]
MSTDGWKNFGKYGAAGDPGNVHGKIALGAALEDALERMIVEGGIKSPVTTRRGMKARVRYLTSVSGGPAAMAEAGITAVPDTVKAWAKGKQMPRPENLEKIDTAYWNLRAANIMSNPGPFKQHLDNGGKGTRVEIHPINQAPVLPSRRRDNLRVRKVQVRYVWGAAVDAMVAGDTSELAKVWDDIISGLDSDWGAYLYVSHVGLGA